MSKRITTKQAKKLFLPSEDDCQEGLHAYIKKAYPKVLSFGNALTGKDYNKKNNYAFESKMKALGKVNGQPDYYIEEPRMVYINGDIPFNSHGLRIELKREKKDMPFHFMPRKKCLNIENDGHLLEQAVFASKYQSKGYMSIFAHGMQQPKDILDWYMGNNTKLRFEKFTFKFDEGRYVPDVKTYWIWKIKD